MTHNISGFGCFFSDQTSVPDSAPLFQLQYRPPHLSISLTARAAGELSRPYSDLTITAAPQLSTIVGKPKTNLVLSA